jgi:hypothetical protein
MTIPQFYRSSCMSLPVSSTLTAPPLTIHSKLRPFLLIYTPVFFCCKNALMTVWVVLLVTTLLTFLFHLNGSKSLGSASDFPHSLKALVLLVLTVSVLCWGAKSLYLCLSALPACLFAAPMASK